MASLTKLERSDLGLVAEGKTNAQIGADPFREAGGRRESSRPVPSDADRPRGGCGGVLIGQRCDGGTVPVDVSLSPPMLDGESFVVAAACNAVAARNAAARQGAKRILRRSEHLVTLEAERERIACGLLDGEIQRLYAAGLHLQATRAADSGVSGPATVRASTQ